MGKQRWLDLGIMLAYLAGDGVGRACASRASRPAPRLTSWRAGLFRRGPWACRMVATLITSVTFIAYPGSAYGKNWNYLIPGFMVVGVLLLVGP